MNVRNTLSQFRAKRGIGAAQLASMAGVSRQTIYAIEAGNYVPNTLVSLKLAHILEISVEDLFQLEQEQGPIDAISEAVLLGDAESLPPGHPLRLCRVNHHIVAVAPERSSWSIPAADAYLLDTPRGISAQPYTSKAKVRIVNDGWKDPSRLLIAGCDPAASILSSTLLRNGCELILAFENSSRALTLLRAGFVHLAGTHLAGSEDGDIDVSPIVSMFPRNSIAIFSYADWREGFAVARGNPKQIAGISDLLRREVRLVNREPGSGCRRLLDDLLTQAGIPPARVRGFNRIVEGQLPAARLVQSGEADCCVCAEAPARSLGLDFIPLVEKPYHFVIHREHLDLPAIQTLLATLGKSSFRREVEACAGYDMREAGKRIR